MRGSQALESSQIDAPPTRSRTSRQDWVCIEYDQQLERKPGRSRRGFKTIFCGYRGRAGIANCEDTSHPSCTRPVRCHWSLRPTSPCHCCIIEYSWLTASKDSNLDFLWQVRRGVVCGLRIPRPMCWKCSPVAQAAKDGRSRRPTAHVLYAASTSIQLRPRTEGGGY